ncbi:MAG: four helix bundle protein [Calditrichaeota bacterium]|nr:MAG: four helix bundle protein [Calditrichota bacterium]
MPGFKKFEDIKVWQEARGLTNLIYTITAQDVFRRDYGLTDQIRRAAISVMSNIAEGFERETDKEFIRFLYIARASAGEVRSQLYIAKDLNYIANEEINVLLDQCLKISSMIYNLIQYLKKERST